ncbi:MAG: alpha/beta fold hydrolase [Solirubrobacteraceae bacterium]
MRTNCGRAQLAWACVGEPGGLDVLMIHAGVTDRRSWSAVVDRLRARHRCVIYDARGYGDTLYEAEDGWSSVADALAVMDAAGCDRACLVAASMGGRVALDFALTYPERVAGLVLIGSGVSGAPGGEPPDGRVARLIADIEAAEAAGDVEDVNRLEAWLWLDGAGAPEGRVAGAVRELFFEMNDRALRAEDPGPQADPEPAWPRLCEITAPTLVLVGDLDLERLHGISESLAASIPVAQLTRLPGVAHLPHLEHDADTLTRIADFVDQLEA